MLDRSILKSPTFNHIIILMVWLFATSFNLFKPIHIDDAAHLEIAEWIAEHPLNPMSGFVNWENSAEPIYKLNQPALYFYALALIGSFTDFNPFILHLFQSLIYLIFIILFYKLARLITPENTIISVILVGCNPGLVINQNLMVDIPLITLWLASFYFLLKPNNSLRNNLIGGIFIGLSVLTKYSSLPLLVIYYIIIAIRFNFKKWWLMLIPTSLLLGWSIFNFYDYEGIHILSRDTKEFRVEDIYNNFLSSLVTLGAISFFSPLLILQNSHRKNQKKVYWILIIAIIVFLIFLAFNAIYMIHEDRRTDFLRGTFILNGLVLLICVIIYLVKVIKLPFNQTKNTNKFILLLWIILPWIFLIQFTPFFATRHMILIIPPLALLFIKPISNSKQRVMAALSIVLTIGITIGLGVSDWKYANFYKSTAESLKVEYPDTKKHIFTGHWGWQYYMKKQGFIQYDIHREQPIKGSLFLTPWGMNQQKLNDSIKLTPHDTIVAPSTPFFSTARKAAFYDCSWKKLPWFITYEPFDTLFIKKYDKNLIFN